MYNEMFIFTVIITVIKNHCKKTYNPHSAGGGDFILELCVQYVMIYSISGSSIYALFHLYAKDDE